MVAAALLGVAVSSAPKAQAANLYWDMDTATAGTGGTGIWTNDKSSNWSVTAAGDTAAGAGTFAVDDVAFFTGTAGTVNFSVLDIGGLVFRGADYVLNGITVNDTLILNSSSGAPVISVTGGNVATLSGILAGGTGLSKTGNGVLRLTNVSNNIYGKITISGGALLVTSASALGLDTSAISIFSANQTPGNTNLYGYGGGVLVLDGTTGGFNLARNIEFEGRGPVGERSAAILSLGNNVLSGTLKSAVSPLTPATFRNTRITSVNGTLTLSGPVISQNAGTFIALGGVNSAGVGDFNLSGVLSGPGSITKDGAGVWHLNPSATSAFSGTIRIGGGSVGQQSSLRVTQVSVGGTSVFGANVGTNASAAIDMNGGVLEFRADGNLNFSALPSGKNVYLRANSTFYVGPAVGGSSINGITTLGTLRVAANTTGIFNSRNGFGITLQAWTPESANNPNTITNNMGGLLSFTAGAWGNNDSTARTLTFDGNGNTSVAGSITASAANHILAKGGTGLLTIEGVGSTYLGNTNISAGAIQITDFGSINNNTAAISLGNATTTTGNLIIGTTTGATAVGLTTSKTITLNTTTASNSIYASHAGANPVILNGAISRIAASTSGALILGGTSTQDNIINVVIPGGGTVVGGVTKLGTGTWVLNAANTYLGATAIQAGTLKLRATAGASDVVGSAGTNTVVFSADTVTQTAGGNLEFRGFLNNATTETLGALTPTAGAATVTLLGNGTGKADLAFTSLGATTAASSLNFVTTGASGGVITLTGQAATTATSLPGTANFLGHLYLNGSNFAVINASAQVVAPSYGATGDFREAGGMMSALQDGFHNKLTGEFLQSSLATISSLLTNSRTLTLDATLTITTGAILQSGGTATIKSFSTTSVPIRTGAAVNMVIRVDLPTDVLNIGVSGIGKAHIGDASQAGGLTKTGAGTLVFFGTNVQTGPTIINEGVVRLSGQYARLSGSGTALTIRQGAKLELDGAISPAFADLIGAGTVTNISGGATTLQTDGSGTWSGIITEAAGAGQLSVIKGGTTGAPVWTGQNNYTGSTTIGGSTGSVTVDFLADGGQPSGIGASTSVATNLVFSSTASAGLIYRGSIYNGSLLLGSRSASTDRLFTLSSETALLQSDVTNNNAIVWSNTGAIAHGIVSAKTLTLGGSSTGDNTFNPKLTDSGVASHLKLSLTKSGAGQWNLGNSNNTFMGTTTVSDGILALNQSGALPANSPLVLGSTTTSGTLQASGTFTRNLSATAVAGTGTITWGGTTGGGGFAAHTTSLTVTLNSGAGLTWGSGGFVGTGGVQTLFFGSASALADVTFTNPIDFGAAKRTISINENGNTGADFATLSGVLSGGAGIGFQKAGSAPLRLTGINTYTGVTDINAGVLTVQSLGSSLTAGGSSVGQTGLAMDNANAVTIGNASTSNATLQHVGPGETSDRKIRINATTGTSAGAQIHADGTGPLILTNVANDMVSNAGSKNLWLRGTSPFLNVITSQLADFGAALNVIVDGGTSWVLTNGTNSYTGTTSVNGGALGIGHNSAISGPLTINNGNVFAHGADRAFGGTLNLANNASSGFYGDYSLTFNGTNNLAAAANNLNVYNSVAAGKSVTFNGMVANSLTANRAWALEGAGETVINGNFTTSTAFGVRIDKSGDGTLVLGTSGATSNWNQSGAAAVDLDRGTLRFSVSEAIPLTSVVSSVTVVHAGLTISPEVLNADVATVDLNGTTQTINALTATTDGTVVINNTSTSAAAFRFGANDAAVSFGSATGTYSVQNTGSGALSLVKLGNTNVTFGAGIALANKGEIAVEGGIFTVAGTVSAATALRAMGTSALALTGPLSSPQLITSVEVGAGASLGFTNGAVSAITGLTSLKLGNTGAGSATLALELGSTANYDRLSTSAAATTGNSVALNLAGIAGFQIGDYDLITATSGLSGATFSLGSVSGTLGGFTLALTPSDTLVRLSASANSGTYYWSGSVNSSWGGMSAVGSNFTNDLAGAVNANGIPGTASSVVFSASNQTVTALSITLDGAMSIKDLTFNNQLGTGPLASIGIAPGTSGTLAITPADSTGGINIQTGAPAAITISAPVTLGASQTWTVADVATILASSGGISGTANLTKDGAGILTLSGTNNYVGTTAIAAGVLQAGIAQGFSGTSAHTVSAGAILRLNGFSATVGSLAGAGTVENGGASNVILTAGGDNSSTTFSGALQNGATATLALTKAGNGMLTLSGTNTNTGTFTVNGGRLSMVTGTTTMSAGQFTTASAANTRGMLLIGSGASITTVDLDFGSNATLSAGAGYQTGGTVVLTAADGNTVFGLGNANTAYGYYEISGGSVNMNRLTLSNTGTSGTGVFRQTGGTVTANTWTLVAHGSGSALLDIAGGVYNSGTNFALSAGGVGAFSFFNVRGSGVFIAATGSTIFANRGDSSARDDMTNVVNLLTGGTIRTASGGITNGTASGATNNFVHVNLNGGTIITNQASTSLININNTNATLTANSGAFVYAGGLTVDTNGLDSTIPSPLQAPAGLGVQSIAVSTEGTGYIGAPVVRISGGTGAGATAVANMVDDGSGNGTFKIGSITITNPGTGYLGTDALTVSFVDNASVYATQATLGAVTFNAGNVSGGLTKDGAGTLTLSGANTYTGGTTVNLGTLALGANNVLADAGNVTIAGGTLDIATFNDTVATVSLQGGVITGSTGVLTSTSAYDLRNGSVSAILGGSVGLNKTTADTVTLSGANTYAGVTRITGGTLAFSAANQLGDASATNTLTLNGGTLSYTGSGTANLVANQGVTIGSSGATLNTSDATGTLNLQGGIFTSAAANLTKTGLGAVSVGLGGSTNLNGGNVTVSAGTLNLGFTASGVGAIAVSAGATLNLYDGSTSTMAINGLTLAAGSSLGFDLGATGVNDVLSLTGTAAITPSVSLNFNALGTLGTGSYDLLSVSAGTLNAADYVLGLAPSGLNYNFTTTNAGQTLRLTTSLLNLVYWKGDVVGGSWSANSSADTNWASDLAGTTDLGVLPAATDTLVFAATSAVGPTFTTTLDGSFTADSLKFTANPTGVTAVSINQGSSGTLTLTPASANNGISVPANVGAVTIGAPIATGAIQTWEVVGGGANGSSLTVTGAVTIGHQISKTGAGVLTLSGSNTGSGGLVLAAGTLVIGNDGALGTGTLSIGAGTTLDTGAAAIINAGNNAQNWNGNFTFTGTNTLNLGAGAVTLGDNTTITTGNTFYVSGAIGDGVATFGLTKSGVGVLLLNGDNTYGGVTSLTNGSLTLSGDNSGATGGVTVAAGTTLNLGHANALGAGTLTFNGGTLDNTSAYGALTIGGNVAQDWNAGFTFTGTHDLVMGSGTVTLGANIPVTVTAGNLTVNGVIDDGLNTFNLEKTGAGTLTLGAANTYGGATTLNEGTLVFAVDQTLTSVTHALNLGASVGSTAAFALDLSAASARFGGSMLVQTDNAIPNTITIGTGKTLQVDRTFTMGYNSAVNSTTRLTISGAGTFKVGDVGAPTNLGFQVGNGATSGISNAATLDMSGLGTFYANLGSGTLRIGDPTNSSGGGSIENGSILILAADSTIIAATITSDSPTSNAIQTIRLGSGTNELYANTITIGAGGNRSAGLLNFNALTGTIRIRALDGVGRTAMNVQNGNAGTGASPVGEVDFRGHSADLLLGTVAVGGRSAAASGNGTGSFSFDTGTLDATTLNIAARTGTTATSGSVTGTVNLGGGTSTIGTVTMSTNSVALTTGSSTGDAVSTFNISGGTVSINALTMGVNTVAAAFANGSNTSATLNLTGGSTTVNTTFTMGAQNSAANAATTVNSALSTLNISAGSLVLAGSTNLTMGGTTLDANNASTASINITGTGSLTVGGNIQYTNGLGTETNTITLDGGTLDLTGGNIGTAGAPITFNAQSGTLRNLAELNGGGALTKSTAGTLILESNNTYTGTTTVSAGKLVISTFGDGVTASSLGTAGLDSANLILATGVTLGYVGAGETSGRGFTMSSDATLDASGTGALAFSSAAKVAFANSTATRSLTLDGTSTAANSFGAGLSVSGTLDADKINLLVKNGVGTWIVANGESLKSTAQIDVNGGLLGLAGGVLPLASRVDLATGTTLRMETGNTDDLGSRIQLDAGAAVTLAVSSDVSFATALTVAGAGSAAVTKSGAGKLTLAADNTAIAGGFTVAQGTLDVTNALGLGVANATVTGGLLTVNAVIANTVNVAAGGTVGGGGSIATLNVVSGARLSPGNSPGTLTAGSAALFGGSTFEWQVQDAADVAKYDHFNVTGTLDLSGASSANRIVFKVVSLLGAGDGTALGNPLNFDTAFSAAPAAQRIKNFSLGTVGSVNLGANANINDVFQFDVSQFTYTDGSTSNAGLWSIDWNSANGAITLTAVPEPSTYGFGLGALALAAAAIRRRRKNQPKA